MPDEAPVTRKALNEVGLTGLNFTPQGTVEEEFLRELQGDQAIKAYKEMRDNDPTVGAILFAIDMLIRQVQWKVQPSDEDTTEDDVTFLEECLDDMSMTLADMVIEIMSMIPFGFSYHEIVYKRRTGPQPETSKVPSSKHDDGKIGWRKIAIRSQDSLTRWEFDDDGGVKGFVQKPPPDFDEITIPITKALLFRPAMYKNNPEGRSVLRNAYRPWYFKKRIEEIEATGIERDLAGLPIAEVDPSILRSDASAEEKATLTAIQKIVTNIKRDKQEGVVWPVSYDAMGHKLYDLKLLSSGGTRAFNTTEIIQRYDQRIAMTVLADFVLLGSQRVGSFALSSDKTDLFAMAMGAWLNTIADTFNRWAVPRLFALNGMDLAHMPKIVPGDIETPPLAEVATYLQALANVGLPLFPNEGLTEYLLRIASLPTPTADDKEAQQEAKNLQEAAAQQGKNEQEAARQRGEQPQYGSPTRETPAKQKRPSGTPSRASVSGNGSQQ